MAEYRGSELNTQMYDPHNVVSVDISDWTTTQDTDSHKKRSEIINAIVLNHRIRGNQSKDQLRTIVDSGWDVNEVLDIHHHLFHIQVTRTALLQAVSQGWTEGVKILLDAGAKWATSDILENPLALSTRCSPELIKLLLKHGADPNDHDDQVKNIPLLRVVRNYKNYRHGTIITKLLLQHGANPNVSHRVNVGSEEARWVHRTALQEAARQGWTEGAKMLLDAGANCTTSGGLQNPLALALRCLRRSPDTIKLLLKHGADPNDHDEQSENIPLLNAFTWHDPIIFQLLLEHEANPNVAHRVNIGFEEDKWVQRTALQDAVSRGWVEGVKMLLDAAAKCVTSDNGESLLALAAQRYTHHPNLFELLLKQHGADVNYTVGDDIRRPLLHTLSNSDDDRHQRFHQKALDLFFIRGGYINMEDEDHRTALECAVIQRSHSNSVRWLIRHGAGPLPTLCLLDEYFRHYKDDCLPDTPLILLQAGMRVSHGAQTQLSNMEVAISAWLQDGNDPHENIHRIIQGILDLVKKTEEEQLSRIQYNTKKSTFPQHWIQQMVDLQEFSDESLDVYPEHTCNSSTRDIRQEYQHILDQIHRVLEFLSQPQSLQWHCRRCVRENLVSLQPSVVKTLPIPAILKRYILCHEI